MPSSERKPIDPRRSASDFVDDLPTREYEDAQVIDAVDDDPEVNPHTSDIKRVAIRPATVLGLAIVVAAFLCGWGTSTMQHAVNDRSLTRAERPDPEPVETVTKTVIKLPTSCKDALDSMSKYLTAASAVSAAGGQQMDLLDDAYQAILARDWQALNVVREKQRDLESTLLPASAKVIPPLVEVQEELEQCRLDAR